MDWDTATIELDKPLSEAHVIGATGGNGPKGDYIEGWHAISEANRIFGYGGWSYQIDQMQLVDKGANKNGTPFVQYVATITVLVGEVSRQDVGYGSGYGQDAHEGATKEAATDALKRALRSFGNQFGLALYDKTRENVGPADGYDHRATTDAIIKAVKAARSMPDLEKTKEGYRKDYERIRAEKPPMANEIQNALKSKDAFFRQNDAAMQAPSPEEIHADGTAAYQ